MIASASSAPLETTPIGSVSPSGTTTAGPLSQTHPPRTTHTRQRYSGRIRGIDIARGLAIIGMIWAHLKPTYVEGLPALLAEIPSGRSSALFAILAGVSIAILTGRNVHYTGDQMHHAQLRIAGRAVILLGFAAILDLFSTPIAVILAFYAAWFLLAIPLVHWSVKRLSISAVVLALAGPQIIQLVNWVTFKHDIWGTSGANGFLYETLISGMYPGLAYMAYVLAGMAIGRLDLTSAFIRQRLLIFGLSVGVLGYLAGWVATQTFAPEYDYWSANFADDEFPSVLWDFFNISPHSNTTPEVVGNLGVGIAILALCLYLSPLAKHVLLPLAAVGSMSLTSYFGHAFFLYWKQDWFFGESLAPFLWVAGAVLVFTTLWAITPLRRGPLEWVTWKFSQWFARPALLTEPDPTLSSR